jgi:hypothetical protein
MKRSARRKRKSKQDVDIVNVSEQDIDALIERSKATLSTEDAELLQKIIASYVHVTKLVGEKETTLRRLRQLFGLATSEKTKDVLKGKDQGNASNEASVSEDAQSADLAASSADGGVEAEASSSEPTTSHKKPGHGRNGVDAYEGATRTTVAHDTLTPGALCPLARIRHALSPGRWCKVQKIRAARTGGRRRQPSRLLRRLEGVQPVDSVPCAAAVGRA